MAAIISRANAEAIIREQVIPEVFQHAPEQSAFFGTCKKNAQYDLKSDKNESA